MLEERLAAEERHYLARTPGSATRFRQAVDVLPGGDTRTGTYHAPYPTYMARGAGTQLWDVDGNRYVDFLGNFTALIHGHAHPMVTAAIVERAALGTAFPFPVDEQLHLAALLQERLPSVQRLRFCNSGTEAVLGAIRAARAFTKRSRILKFEGGYHGSYDAAQVSVAPPLPAVPFPAGVPSGPGLSPGLVAEVLVAPFNDTATAATIIHTHRTELAAVLLEPAMTAAGVIPPDPGFLDAVFGAAREAGVLVILDEIITFRLGLGGGQARFGVVPDLTTLGKIIGGGLPVGAFGGRADVMATYDPRSPGAIAHSGTFNGNALTMAAGLAAMRLLTPDAFASLDALGERLRAGLRAACEDGGVPATVTGVGSLAHLHFCPGPVRNYRDSQRSDRLWTRCLHLGLLNRGFACATRGMFALSTASTHAEVDALCEAVRDVVRVVRPVGAREA
ncbi:MAG: aspartate aminotransferase family protein [Gemmatimonadaceae bacterium]